MGGTKKIAIVLPGMGAGGVERVRLLLGAEFIKRGYSVEYVLLQARGELLPEIPEQARVVDLGVFRLRSSVVPLYRYIRCERPDAMLVGMWPLTGIIGLAVRVAGVSTRLVVSEHSDFRQAPWLTPNEKRLLRVFGRWFYRPANVVVCVSKGVSDSLRQVAGLDPKKIAIIYNPIRPDYGNPVPHGDGKLLAWWKGGAKSLLGVGSLKRAKDFPTLIRSLKILRESVDARLLILGEGRERSALEKLVAETGLCDAVKLPGYRADPYPFLREADLFVLSSAWEGLGNVIIESLLCGTPVVATDCQSGPAEILDFGRFGTLVPVGDEKALAIASSRTLESRHDVALLRQRANEFCPEAAAEKYLTLLFG